MFATIFRKEILDQILSPKFLIVSLLCLVLIPASLALNYASYRSAYQEFEASQREAKTTTTVYREPSVLSTFGVGLESVLPKTVVFSKYQTEAKGTQAQNEVLSNINGKLDFVVITGFLLGLFAVLYAGSLVSGEKETGTLKLVLSNPAERSAVITAKYLGGFSVLLIPFGVSTLLGVLILLLEGFPLFAAGNLGRIAALAALSALYLSALFCLGLLISTRTHRTSMALLAGFFVWIFLTFVIPKTSEPIAGLIRRVPSEEVMKANRAQVRNQIDKEKGQGPDPAQGKVPLGSGAGPMGLGRLHQGPRTRGQGIRGTARPNPAEIRRRFRAAKGRPPGPQPRHRPLVAGIVLYAIGPRLLPYRRGGPRELLPEPPGPLSAADPGPLSVPIHRYVRIRGWEVAQPAWRGYATRREGRLPSVPVQVSVLR